MRLLATKCQLIVDNYSLRQLLTVLQKALKPFRSRGVRFRKLHCLITLEMSKENSLLAVSKNRIKVYTYVLQIQEIGLMQSTSGLNLGKLRVILRQIVCQTC